MADNSYLSSEPVTKTETEITEKYNDYMKNISPFMSKDLIAAAGFNVEAPLIEAIIGNLMGTLPTKKNEAEIIICQICDCELSSNTALNIHTNGLRHKKRLKALEIIEQLKETRGDGIQFTRDCENPNILWCEICSKSVNSAQQLEIHLSGVKHKRKVFKAAVINTMSDPFRKTLGFSYGTDSCKKSTVAKKKKNELKETSCDICKIFLNSQTQYDEHLLSKKHLMKTKRITKHFKTISMTNNDLNYHSSEVEKPIVQQTFSLKVIANHL